MGTTRFVYAGLKLEKKFVIFVSIFLILFSSTEKMCSLHSPCPRYARGSLRSHIFSVEENEIRKIETTITNFFSLLALSLLLASALAAWLSVAPPSWLLTPVLFVGMDRRHGSAVWIPRCATGKVMLVQLLAELLFLGGSIVPWLMLPISVAVPSGLLFATHRWHRSLCSFFYTSLRLMSYVLLLVTALCYQVGLVLCAVRLPPTIVRSAMLLSLALGVLGGDGKLIACSVPLFVGLVGAFLLPSGSRLLSVVSAICLPHFTFDFYDGVFHGQHTFSSTMLEARDGHFASSTFAADAFVTVFSPADADYLPLLERGRTLQSASDESVFWLTPQPCPESHQFKRKRSPALHDMRAVVSTKDDSESIGGAADGNGLQPSSPCDLMASMPVARAWRTDPKSASASRVQLLLLLHRRLGLADLAHEVLSFLVSRGCVLRISFAARAHPFLRVPVLDVDPTTAYILHSPMDEPDDLFPVPLSALTRSDDANCWNSSIHWRPSPPRMITIVKGTATPTVVEVDAFDSEMHLVQFSHDGTSYGVPWADLKQLSFSTGRYGYTCTVAAPPPPKKHDPTYPSATSAANAEYERSDLERIERSERANLRNEARHLYSGIAALMGKSLRNLKSRKHRAARSAPSQRLRHPPVEPPVIQPARSHVSSPQTLPEFSDGYALAHAQRIADGHPLVTNTLRELPPSAQSLLVARLRPLLLQYLNDNEAQREEVFLTFLGFPGTRLLRPFGRQRIRRRKTAQALFDSGAPVEEHDSEMKDSTAEEKVLRRAISFAKRGYLSKAARTLDSIAHPITKTMADLRSTMESLHPRLRQPLPHMPLAVPQTVSISIERACVLCAHRRRGASPGPTGWTEELLTPLFRDSACAKALGVMLTDIANAKVSPTVGKVIAASRLVPLGKKDDGVRPVAVGESLIRIVGAVLLEQNSAPIKAHFNDHQFALMRENGLEHVVHSILGEMQHDDCHIVTIDARNAFNTAARSTMAHELLGNTELHCFVPMFMLLYGSPSLLFLSATTSDGVLTTTITSEDGSRQGCPFGMFLFCLSLQPSLRELGRRHIACRFRAIADDITISCRSVSSSAIVSAYLDLVSLLATIGLVVNGAKCEAYGPTDFSKALSTASVVGVPAFCVTGVKLLGTFASKHTDAQSLFLVDKLRKHDLFSTRLLALDANHALPILSKCLVPRMGYYMRTHPPEATHQAANCFDEMILSIVRHHVGLAQDLTPVEQLCLHLPRAVGGCGIQSCALVAPHAWAAAAAEVACTSDVLPESQRTRVDSMNKELLVPHLANRDMARALRSRATESLWMDDLNLDARSVVHGWRARLGRLPAGLPGTAMCPGCDFTAENFSIVDHVLGCARVVGHNASVRHAAAQRFFIQSSWDAGVPAGPATHYTVGDRGDEKHPDFEFVISAHRTVVDHTFLGDFTGPSIAAREKRKRDLYGDLVRSAGASFVPAVISTYGRLTDTTKRMLHAISGVEELLCRGTDRRISDAARERWFEFRSQFDSLVARENGAILSTVANAMARRSRG